MKRLITIVLSISFCAGVLMLSSQPADASVFDVLNAAKMENADGRSLTQLDFKRIGENGFGDKANSYSWSLAWFKGDLYVGVNRHHLWSMLQTLKLLFAGQDFDFEIPEVTGPPGEMGSTEWADAMSAEIWRYRGGKWTRVFQSDLFHFDGAVIFPGILEIPPGEYPVAYGYRTLGVYDGYIYACGVGTWWPTMPFSSIIRSKTGDPGDWEDVSMNLRGTNNVRGLVEFKGKLFVSVSTSSDTLGGQSLVYYTNDPSRGWTLASDAGFGNSDNAEVYYLSVFNGHLYASTVNYKTGFEVWKTNGIADSSGKFQWKRVVNDGFGDTWNQYGMTMEPFGDYLYVGTAVGIGMVLKDNQPVGTRAIDLIRIDKDDNVELVMGAYSPDDPPPGWPTSRMPMSKWPAGFGNPFNVYTWHMKVHEGWLYLGTFDMSGFVFDLLPYLFSDFNLGQSASELGEALGQIPLTSTERSEFQGQLALLDQSDSGTFQDIAIGLLKKVFGGADLWKTRDGINWIPVTLNGFGNVNNYGIRRILSVSDEVGSRMYIGTANPFTDDPNGGCEVWRAPWRFEISEMFNWLSR